MQSNVNGHTISREFGTIGRPQELCPRRLTAARLAVPEGQQLRLMNENMEVVAAETKAAFEAWIEAYKDGERSTLVSKAVVDALANESAPVAAEILKLKQYLVKKSFWIFGGDGWAYDIGYGGLDHVIASGENVNILRNNFV